MSQDFDLNLSSLWFCQNPPAFPLPSMTAKGPCTSTYSWTSSQDHHTTRKVLTCTVRWTTTQATTKVRIEWLTSDPAATATSQQHHSPAPPPLSPGALQAAHASYGENVATWVSAALGTTVGDGECWTLVHRALLDLAATYRRHGQRPPQPSQGRNHGQRLLALDGAAPGSCAGLLLLADVRRGDILELSHAHFRSVQDPAVLASGPSQPWGRWQLGPREVNVRLVRHTAVIVGVEGDAVSVVEQNGSVRGGVGRGRYDLGCMLRGRVEVFRVVGVRGEEDDGWVDGLSGG